MVTNIYITIACSLRPKVMELKHDIMQNAIH